MTENSGAKPASTEAEPLQSGLPTVVDEAWLDREISKPTLAAFHAGRLLNAFRFHARQAFLLWSPGQVPMARRQMEASVAVLDHLPACALVLEINTSVREQISKLRDEWIEYFRSDSHEEDLQSSFDTFQMSGRLTHGEICDRAVLATVDPFYRCAVRLIESGLATPEIKAAIAFGECLDLGIRPANSHRWLFPSEAELADKLEAEYGMPLEEIDEDKLVSWGADSDDDTQNPLAQRSRAAGDITPLKSWYRELRAAAKLAGFKRELPPSLKLVLGTAAPAGGSRSPMDLVQMVDRLDREYRDAIVPPRRKAGRRPNPVLVERDDEIRRLRKESRYANMSVLEFFNAIQSQIDTTYPVENQPLTKSIVENALKKARKTNPG